ncbi:MAG: methyltransferase domain-containing protein [Verrucomicrobia bacterium]|nr:methyltransferase domain-containing protein [Verrucomicrobiota bacterium]
MKTESVVKKRYADGANAQEPALCCPVEYDPQYLKVIPDEVIERDYGCGDPSQYLKPGETVLDLGSGTGKICFIASQVVGSKGKVIGVDMTDDMLDVARRNAPLVAEKIGYANVEFRKGRIQDLALDLEAMDSELKARPIDNANHFVEAEELADELRVKKPLIPDDSIDVVVSNCVLNLVSMSNRLQLFEEIFRVLKLGGRAVISDIVSDETVSEEMMKDPDLWSGCISGAFREDEFLQAFEDAGFYGIQILKLDTEPWQTVQGIEFKSMTIEAFKGKQGACLDRNQAVIYKGPFKKVLDDDDHPMERGKRYAVCDKTYQLYRKAPYAEFFEFITPREEVPSEQAEAFDDSEMRIRHPRSTKGENYAANTDASECCGSDCC